MFSKKDIMSKYSSLNVVEHTQCDMGKIKLTSNYGRLEIKRTCSC